MFCEGLLNVDTGQKVSIRRFVEVVAEIVGYRGELAFDTSPTRRRQVIDALVESAKTRGVRT